ncbi:unnamed protein product [Miscanthus lutarioriparius]|uniref:Uncharacterized protein n=1 Tax=Miscanthus lutarioriparius TaxID=422564 RepID=A0A811RR70_9POAL|nr:unnamed protein product [Miscanthus lutarioriparius]
MTAVGRRFVLVQLEGDSCSRSWRGRLRAAPSRVNTAAAGSRTPLARGQGGGDWICGCRVLAAAGPRLWRQPGTRRACPCLLAGSRGLAPAAAEAVVGAMSRSRANGSAARAAAAGSRASMKSLLKLASECVQEHWMNMLSAFCYISLDSPKKEAAPLCDANNFDYCSS